MSNPELTDENCKLVLQQIENVTTMIFITASGLQSQGVPESFAFRISASSILAPIIGVLRKTAGLPIPEDDVWISQLVQDLLDCIHESEPVSTSAEMNKDGQDLQDVNA